LNDILVRNIDDAIHARRKREADAASVGVNALMQQLIRSGFSGLDRSAAEGPNLDLDRLAGRWTERHEAAFFATIGSLPEIDEASWR